jgi:FKBP-type peptidyl-prolyl cis-trans isomerase
MKLQLLSAVLASTLATAALAQTAPAVKPATPAASGPIDKANLAYAIGYQLGYQWANQAPGLDVVAINRAFQDAYAKRPPTIDGEKLEATLLAFEKQQQAEAKARFDTASRENKLKSDAAIASNKTKPGVVSLPSGIQYKVIEAGAGARPTLNSTVEFHFSGALATTGQAFASTFADIKPVTRKLGEVVEIPGMQEIMQQMPTGARWQVLLPPEKAFGSGPQSMRTPGGPNQAILLDIKLISVK